MPDRPPDNLRDRLAALADPSGLLEEIFANAPVGLQIYERSGRCVIVNSAFTELFGAAPPPEYNVFTDNVLVERGVADLVKRAFAGERVSIPAIWYDIRELRNLPPSMDRTGGKRRAIAAEMMPLRDHGGEFSHVLIVFTDETSAHEAREDAEGAARNAERARLAAETRATQSAFLANAARLLASSLDLEVTLAQVARLATTSFADFCIIDLVNDDGSFRRVATFHADPAKQQILDELQAKYPPLPGSVPPAARVVASGRPELISIVDESVYVHRVRSDEHLELHRRLGARSHIACPLRVGDRVLGVIGVGNTSTGRYTEADMPLVEALSSLAAVAIENSHLFSEAEKARRDAEAANRAKDEFLAMLGHELRNPLAPIVSALELTRQREGATTERTVMERQVDHLRRLVDDLLDVSRITRGALELETTSVDLAAVIAEGVELARPLIEQRRHEVLLAVARPLLVHGDRVRLAQIFGNLVINAARYTDPGGRISVTAERAGNVISVRVRDNGTGIAPDLLPHVFEPFTRGARTVERSTSGLGLGLAIVKELVMRHGGRVAAHSEGTGKGTELEIVLPAHDASPLAQMPASAMPPVGPREGTILVVDDNRDAVETLAEALHLHGFTTVVATDPHDAIALAREHRPRVALVDLGLPGMDGYGLAERLRQADPAVRIVALTGYGQKSDRDRTSAAGFVEHLVKPAKLTTLIPLIERLLAGS